MQHPPAPAAAGRGFTLVEVLVALFIMAVLAGLAWRGVDALVRARDGSRAVIEATQRLNTVLTQWEQDLAAVHDTGSVPALAFDGRTLRLTRSAEGGVRLVAWALHESDWQRWAGPPTTRVAELQQTWLASQQLLGTEPGQLKVLPRVDSVQVFFYRGNAWTNAQSTGDVVVVPRSPRPPAAPASAASGAAPAPPAAALPDREQLPDAVRLVLGIDGQRLTRDIALAPQMP
jgi:general secretion pathway protein J